MNQNQGVEVYMAKQDQLVQSYLITLVDGTVSMQGEYKAVIEAHQDVFSYLGDKKMDYQWEQNLYSFTPFKSAGSGNISKTFQSIFEKLLTQTFPPNITFLFVSDGQQHFELEEISGQIEQVKTKYLIQFISVAVGDGFPSQISNKLRNEIHNQNSSCPAVFKVNRKHQSFDVLYKEFSDIFQEIKNYLNVQEKHFETSQPFFQTLVSENLDLKQNEKEMTDSQREIRDPIKVLEHVEKNAQQIELKDQTEEKAKLRMQFQFKNIKLGCYVKSKDKNIY